MCGDNIGYIQLAYGKKTGDYLILVAEMLTIQTALETIIHEKLSNIIIESHSLTAIQAIYGEYKLPK